MPPLKPLTHKPKSTSIIAKKHLVASSYDCRIKTPYNYRWQRVRDHWLKYHPLCVHCMDKGILKAANEVDHVIPHKGDMKLFWDNSNYQSLCKSCHSKKTSNENK